MLFDASLLTLRICVCAETLTKCEVRKTVWLYGDSWIELLRCVFVRSDGCLGHCNHLWRVAVLKVIDIATIDQA